MIKPERVQQRLDDLDLNPFSAARRAGLESGYVRDILRGKIKEPGAEKLRELSMVLKCSPDYLMGRLDVVGQAPNTAKAITMVVDLSIRHEAAAGNWLAIDELRDEPFGSAPTALVPEYAQYAQWLERVRGDSMDRLLPDGALVHVVDAIEMGYTPHTGDLVIATRTRAQGAFIERSIKQVAVTGAGLQLWPRSYNARWSEPLSLTEGVRENDDVEVAIVGKVVRAYLTF